MRLYIFDSQIPELASLDRAQSRVVKADALKVVAENCPWVGWLSSVLCAAGSLLVYVILIVLTEVIYPQVRDEDLPNKMKLNFMLWFVAAGAGGSLGGFIGRQLVIRKLRTFWRERQPDGPSKAIPGHEK